MLKKLLSTKFILAILLAAGALTALPTDAFAFDKNRLIDDSLFVDHDSMTIPQIQAFLDSQGSLLANWVDNVDMRRPSDNCVVHHATGMTAAEIIHEAATAWGAQVYDSNGCAIENAYWSDPGYSNYTLQTVSPKALLVTLQKEQSLLSANGTYSTNPNDYKDPACCASNEYKLARAMGYGVPDTGSINEKYLGFYNQINWAAWQFRFNFERSAGNTAWDEVGYITYSGPMIEGNFKRCASCSTESFDGFYPIDGSPLYMENRATASLYYYTPHTYPGFVGNYNFVQFYTNWFGAPTQEPDFSWSMVSQEVFTDATENTALSVNPTLEYKDRVFAKLTIKNDGNQVWGTNIRLATDNKRNRTSSICDSSWIGCKRPTQQSESSVAPGENATFDFWINAGDVAGFFDEDFRLLKEGQEWFEGPTITHQVTVVPPDWHGTFTKERFFTDAGKTDEVARNQLKNGRKYYVEYSVRNDGAQTWTDSGANEVRLGAKNNVTSPLCDSGTWLSCTRPGNADQSSVAPGETATFTFIIDVPFVEAGTNYLHEWELLREGIAWFNYPAMATDFEVNSNLTSWEITSVNSYTDATETTNKDLETLTTNDSAYVVIVVRNVSGATWNQNGGQPLHLATNNPRNRLSAVCDPSDWIDCKRLSKLEETSVAPGGTGTFKFWISTPPTPRGGTEHLILVRENAYWLGNAGLSFDILAL